VFFAQNHEENQVLTVGLFASHELGLPVEHYKTCQLVCAIMTYGDIKLRMSDTYMKIRTCVLSSNMRKACIEFVKQ